jgi:AcrR family transcriptional regulator
MTPDKAKKSEQTRQKLVDVSMKLFLEQGFDNTTMREVARAAGLAAGAAYYYFPSKEALIFGFYERSFDEHLPEAEKALQKEKKLEDRLAAVIAAHLKVSERYHGLSKVLFRVAADPEQAISPFSIQSKPLRDRNIDLMRRVLEGTKLPEGFAKPLPELLWLYKMGMLLYWLHDKSAGHKKTYQLVEKSSALVAQLIRISALPVVRTFSLKALGLFEEFKGI